MSMLVAEIELPRPVYQAYSYRITEGEPLPAKGSRALVSFGSQELLGLISGFSEARTDLEYKDLFLPENFAFLDQGSLDLLQWMSLYYLQPKGEVASLFLPHYVPGKEVSFQLARPIVELLNEIPKSKKVLRQGLIRLSLESDFPFTQSRLESISLLSQSLLREARKKNWLKELHVRQELPELKFCYKRKALEFPDLNEQQALAVHSVLAGGAGVYYLHGVTGSGKTEVYLHLMDKVLEKGGGVIFLVPEISLTPQMERLFLSRFGDQVAIHHSRISDKQKYAFWLDLRSGNKKIAMGARSALFAPVQNLQLIILDEEGEGSYRQDTSPFYDARMVARQMQKIRQCQLLFGSATPSMQSCLELKSQKMPCLSMPKRYNQRNLPEIKLVDLKEEFRLKNRSIFSTYLKKRIREETFLGNQVILFVNRRGHSSFVMCRACSHVIECPRCSVSLTYHHDQADLRCHYCAFFIPMPQNCPSCESTAIKFFGLGTQKVEEFFQQEFPGLKFARLDTDVTRHKGILEDTLEGMRKKDLQVLIGTQMISKGLDFEDVTLIGVLNPDALVRMGDFSARERAFSLLVQIAGRAGRKDKSGEVILQTYSPRLAVYDLLKSYDWDTFVRIELADRESGMFPPYCHLIQILATAEDQNRAMAALKEFEALLNPLQPQFIECHKPQPSPLEKIDQKFRCRMVIKTHYSESLWQSLFALRQNYKNPKNVHLKILVDPDNLL